jgi:quaternary ammonium compound-resistance protein SugE
MVEFDFDPNYGVDRRALLAAARCGKFSSFTAGKASLASIEELSMSWIILLLAGLLEVAWAIGLKQSAGFTKLWPSVFTAVTMAASIALLGLALRELPLGTAYAVWTGIGTVGTVIVGIMLLGEPAGLLRLVSIGLIVAGIIGLKVLTPA